LRRAAERYSADYGDLRLEVHLRTREQEHVFEFRVLDNSDGSALWIGSAPDLESAQSSALFEAQIFADTPLPPDPQWRREAELGTQT
jgi:hypothetical protein